MFSIFIFLQKYKKNFDFNFATKLTDFVQKNDIFFIEQQ